MATPIKRGREEGLGLESSDSAAEETPAAALAAATFSSQVVSSDSKRLREIRPQIQERTAASDTAQSMLLALAGGEEGSSPLNRLFHSAKSPYLQDIGDVSSGIGVEFAQAIGRDIKRFWLSDNPSDWESANCLFLGTVSNDIFPEVKGVFDELKSKSRFPMSSEVFNVLLARTHWQSPKEILELIDQFPMLRDQINIDCLVIALKDWISMGDLDQLKPFLAMGGIRKQLNSEHLNRLVYHAAFRNQSDFLTFLILSEMGRDDTLLSHISPQIFTHSLIFAVKKGRLKLFKTIFSHRFVRDSIFIKEVGEVIIKAAQHQYFGAIQWLLESCPCDDDEPPMRCRLYIHDLGEAFSIAAGKGEESFIRFILDECPRLSGEPPLVSRFSDGDLSNAVINAARSMHEGILMRLLMNWDVRSNLKGSSIGLALRCVVRYQTPRLLDIMLETFDLFRQVNRNDVWKAIQNGAHCGKVFVIDRLLRKKWARNEIPDERLEMIFLQAAKHSEADVFNSLLSEDLIDEDEKLLSHRLFARGLDPVINSLIMEKKAESLGFLLQDIEICRRLSQPMLDQIIFFFMCEAKVEWLGPLLQDVDVCSEISGEKLGQLVHNLICTKEDRLLGVFLRSSMAYQRLPEKNLGQVIYHLMSSAQHELLELLLGDPKLQARVLDYHLGNILIHSIRINQTVSIKILIDSGARFRIPTKHLGMALIEAAHLDQPEVIQILIEKDDLRERLIANRSIEQAHHIANYLGHKRVLELLRRDGVND